jgi:hypothetical protein
VPATDEFSDCVPVVIGVPEQGLYGATLARLQKPVDTIVE